MCKLRVVHKLISYTLFIFLSVSCNKNKDYDVSNTRDLHLKDLLVDGASNTLIKFKKDTLLLQEELKKSIELNDTILQIAINKKLGEIHIDNFHRRSALQNKRAYLALAQSINAPLQELIALNGLGDYYYSVDMLDDALRFYFNALSVSRNISSDSEEVVKQLSIAKLGIGSIYTFFNNKEYASNWLDMSIGLASLLSDNEVLSDIYIAKSDLSKEKNQYDSAKIYIDRAIDGYIAQNSTAGLGLGFLKMGTLSIELNNYEEAIVSLENALGTLHNTSEKINIMKSTLLIGKAYLKLYNYTMAEKYLIEADRLSKELNSSIHSRNSNFALSEVYFAQNNIKESSRYNDLARKYESDINNIKIQSGIFNAYMEYEKSRNLQEINDIKMDYTIKSKVKNIIIVSTIFVILFLIIIFIVFNRYWNKRRETNESIISSALLKVNLFNHFSKELKSPLIIIDGLVERLKHSIDEGNKTSNLINLEIIELQTQNISFLIDETISLSQAKYNIKSKWVNGNIVNFLQFLFNSFSDDARNRGVNMSFIANKPEINMIFCKERLQLAIINILYLTIRNSVKDDKIFLSVSHNDTDTICQISIVHKSITSYHEELPSEFKDLLTSFNNSDDEPMSRLALLQKTIEDMGGTFSFYNENENDSSFNLSFPIKNNKRLDKYREDHNLESDSGKNVSSVSDKLRAFSSQSGNKHHKESVMIVEDNQFMSFYISSLISNKYNVISCQSGIEALKEIEKNPPDLIITD